MSQTQLNSSVQQRHQRRLSTVHLAGLSIITHTQRTLRGTSWQTHNSNVLMHALRAPAVLLSTGIIRRIDAMCMTNVVDVILILPSYTMKSSDDVTLRQVGRSKCSFTEIFRSISRLSRLPRDRRKTFIFCL